MLFTQLEYFSFFLKCFIRIVYWHIWGVFHMKFKLFPSGKNQLPSHTTQPTNSFVISEFLHILYQHYCGICNMRKHLVQRILFFSPLLIQRTEHWDCHHPDTSMTMKHRRIVKTSATMWPGKHGNCVSYNLCECYSISVRSTMNPLGPYWRHSKTPQKMGI